MTQAGLTTANSRAVWQRLQANSQSEAHFEPAHVGYYFGALLVIGAMGWFITHGWDSFKGWQLAVIAAGYALAFVVVGRAIWSNPIFKIWRCLNLKLL